MLVAILVVGSVALLGIIVLLVGMADLLDTRSKEKTVMATLTDLEASLKADTDATNAATNLILGLVAQLQAAKNEPAKIQAMIDQLSANATALAKAVTDNTPAAA